MEPNNVSVSIKAYRRPEYGGRIDLYADKVAGPERGFCAEKLVFVHVDLYAKLDPMLSVTDAEAQILMDSLWDCGIRPTSGHGSAGQLAATERHLADVQSMAFQALKMKQPANARPEGSHGHD